MRIFKLLLAWFDWSNYGEGLDYKKPKTMCSLFWRTLFGLIALPFVYPTHIVNLFFGNDFKDDVCSDNKVTMGLGLFIHIILLIFGGPFIDKIYETNPSNLSELGYYYITLIGLGLLVSIIICLIVLIFLGIVILLAKIKEYIINKHEENALQYVTKDGDIIDGHKNKFLTKIMEYISKYCISISWDDIKSK